MSTQQASKPVKEDAKVENTAAPSTPAAAAAADKPKLSNAELKKQKQAEKAARRAKVIEKKVEAGGVIGSAEQGKDNISAVDTENKGKENGAKEKPVKGEKQPAKKDKSVKDEKAKSSESKDKPAQPKVKLHPWTHHLPERKRPGDYMDDPRYIRHHVYIVGLKMNTYEIMGSSARMLAMLAAFKSVIMEYQPPEDKTINRHFVPNVLSDQITFLSSCRPLSISMGNAIRWLKRVISNIEDDMPIDEAKEFLTTKIDEFSHARSTLAQELLSKYVCQSIEDGDKILLYGKSDVVEKTLRKAYADGKRFELLIIDNEPYHEGRKFLKVLTANDELKDLHPIKIGTSNSISDFTKQCTKVFLGAHAIFSNGSLCARAGAAGIAAMARKIGRPVIVLCESVKFSEKTPSTALQYNERCPDDEIMPEKLRFGEDATSTPNKPDVAVESFASLCERRGKYELNPQYKNNYKLFGTINLMYDIIPAEHLSMVFSEHGIVPSTSVPGLNRVHNEVNEEA